MSQNNTKKNSGTAPPNNIHLRLRPGQTRWVHDQIDEDKRTPQDVVRDLIDEKRRGQKPKK